MRIPTHLAFATLFLISGAGCINRIVDSVVDKKYPLYDTRPMRFDPERPEGERYYHRNGDMKKCDNRVKP